MIYEQVDAANGRNYAIICDEAHSSQTGSSAMKLKTALADLRDALKEYAEIEGIEEEKVDPQDKLVRELIAHGRHKNLSFFAFTATPKDTTLEMFGEQDKNGQFHPFHIYSMHQAIEEGFILDVLQNYMTYKTCFKIANSTPDNPEVPASRASKVIKKYQQLHPENIRQKSEIIVETFMGTTRGKINGRAKMMVVTASRPAAVLFFKAIKRYAEDQGYGEVKPLVAFSGEVILDEESYTESGLNVRPDGSHISEAQTKQEFHDHFNILIVAEKYQTGFDEPLLHTMIVDKKLRGVKTVQTLSRLNRTCPGKNDTFILDFANEKEDVQADFQVFYHETFLEEEVNTDLLYKVQRELRNFGIYGDMDILHSVRFIMPAELRAAVHRACWQAVCCRRWNVTSRNPAMSVIRSAERCGISVNGIAMSFRLSGCSIRTCIRNMFIVRSWWGCFRRKRWTWRISRRC